MSLLLETIRIIEGKPQNLSAHEERITRSQLALDGERLLSPLEEIFDETPPPLFGILKARIIYNHDLFKIEYQSYQKAKINKLKIHRENSIYYPHKFADRSAFESIKKSLSEYTEALIVIGERVTDTTYTNLAFWNGNKWLTPEFPMLQGTMRSLLINQNTIELMDISVNDLDNFQKIRLFNSMMPWDEAIEIPISQVY